MGENYPAHLETSVSVDSHTEALFRPVRPEDETMIQDFFYSLSERTIYSRFFAHLKFFPLSFLHGFARIDYRTKMTVLGLAEEGGNENIIAMGHYVVDGQTGIGEPAIIVRDDWQKRGVGRLLFDYLIDIAKESGLPGLTAEVLKENEQMIKLLSRAGFNVSQGIGKSSRTAELKFMAEAQPSDPTGS